jgi:hypothetical protein
MILPPKILRGYYRYDRKLLTRLCQCADCCLLRYFRTILNAKSDHVDTVSALQTFGDYGRWHPYLHLLGANDLFMPNGSLHVMMNIGLRPLQKLFRTSVQKMLKREGKIDDEFNRMLMQWRHVSGFNIHNGVKPRRPAPTRRNHCKTFVCEEFDDGWGRSDNKDVTPDLIRDFSCKSLFPEQICSFLICLVMIFL